MQQERTRNIKLLLEYDGSRYAGWQKMAGKERMVTIQGKLEEVLEKMEPPQHGPRHRRLPH